MPRKVAAVPWFSSTIVRTLVIRGVVAAASGAAGVRARAARRPRTRGSRERTSTIMRLRERATLGAVGVAVEDVGERAVLQTEDLSDAQHRQRPLHEALRLDRDQPATGLREPAGACDEDPDDGAVDKRAA